MNRQKLATIACIILSIVFSVSFGLFIHFKVLMPISSDVYENLLYYPEDLYKEYEEEAERMLLNHEYTCQYPAQITTYHENGHTTLIIKIGDYDRVSTYSNYVTVTAKNSETNEQEITFERSRKSAEEAYESAERYRTFTSILTLAFIVILIIFTAYLIKKSIKRHYTSVLYPISLIVVSTVMAIAMKHFLFS